MLIRRTPSMIDRFFEDWNRSLSDFAQDGQALAMDVHENDEAYIITADIPGVDSDNIDIRLHENVLTIQAETRRENHTENGNTLVRERYAGRVSRSVRLPQPVNSEAVEASYDNGVLSLVVPKAEEIKPRRITINTARNN